MSSFCRSFPGFPCPVERSLGCAAPGPPGHRVRLPGADRTAAPEFAVTLPDDALSVAHVFCSTFHGGAS